MKGFRTCSGSTEIENELNQVNRGDLSQVIFVKDLVFKFQLVRFLMEFSETLRTRSVVLPVSTGCGI